MNLPCSELPNTTQIKALSEFLEAQEALNKAVSVVGDGYPYDNQLPLVQEINDNYCQAASTCREVGLLATDEPESFIQVGMHSYLDKRLRRASERICRYVKAVESTRVR